MLNLYDGGEPFSLSGEHNYGLIQFPNFIQGTKLNLTLCEIKTKKAKQMTDFTKIKWAGIDCILVTTTNEHNPKLPLLILDEQDIEDLNKEWRQKNG